jgi:1-acyl-sn-glycerol-3-phosphate acyltransferase
MIIKSKPLKPFFFWWGGVFISWILKRRFNKIIINDIKIKPGHSYLLMCNHFSFLDGFLAYYLCNKLIWGDDKMKRLYIMSLKKQMLKNKWLQYIGSFSIDPGKRSIKESFDYAAEVLSQPGNLLLFYPQGNLESQHITHIHFEAGLNEIVPRIQGKCQLIWTSNILEYFESGKPSLYFNLLDCDTNQEFDFKALQQQVNAYHKQALYQHVRFTKQDS